MLSSASSTQSVSGQTFMHGIYAAFVSTVLTVTPATGPLSKDILQNSDGSQPLNMDVVLVVEQYSRDVFFIIAQASISQSDNEAPGPVVLTIKTNGAGPGYATNTAAIPAPSGNACIVDDERVEDGEMRYTFELTRYTVVDGSHLRLSLTRPHAAGATLFIGTNCRYRPEPTRSRWIQESRSSSERSA